MRIRSYCNRLPWTQTLVVAIDEQLSFGRKSLRPGDTLEIAGVQMEIAEAPAADA